MRAGAIAVTITAFAASLVGCSSDPECAGIASIDQGVAAGQPSARAALDALLATHPRWLSQTGWAVGYRASTPDTTLTYVAPGGDKVKVVRSSKNGRWYLDSYRGCR
jgi:hypothetical protein